MICCLQCDAEFDIIKLYVGCFDMTVNRIGSVPAVRNWVVSAGGIKAN